MRKLLIAALVLAVASSGVAIGYYLNPVGVPPVKGYMEGKEIRFIHTEASDGKVAELLSDMMGSPVLVVPSLAQASEAMLANVYVFTNGIKGEGPFKFQPDVFDNPPGTDGYSPFRALNLVAWKDEQTARQLRSAAEVKAAVTRDEVTIKRPGVVINMPVLTWPGGRR
ncbi:MAG: hypothetical protein ACE5JU_01785 [Candidatus Binatia bacterium]